MELDLDIGFDVSMGTAVSIDILEVDLPLFPPMKEGEKAGPYNCLVFDTINELQDLEYIGNIEKKGKADFQAYIDLNVNVKVITNLLKRHFEEVVLIVGPEGSGKSFGVKSLDPRKTIWLNTDDKPSTFKGGRNNYGRERWNIINGIYDYATLKKHIEKVAEMKDPNVPFVVFMLGHLGVDNITGRQKLKTIGKFSEKLNLDGAVTNCYYTNMIPKKEGNIYYLDTQNTGNNSGRCLEELFPSRYIPINFEYIRQQIINY